MTSDADRIGARIRALPPIEPPEGWQDRVVAALGLNPDPTARRYIARIDYLATLDEPDAVAEELAYWAWREGGPRDIGGES